MESPFARRWARLGLYFGLVAAAGITLYWLLAAGRADWFDSTDDPAVDAHRWAAVVSLPTSWLAFQLVPSLKQFAYWAWVVVLGPPLNGMALGALAGLLRDRAGTRRVLDVTAPAWIAASLLLVGAVTAWVGFVSLTIVIVFMAYAGLSLPFVALSNPRIAEGFYSPVAVAWLALPLGLILLKRAIPAAAGRWILVAALASTAAWVTSRLPLRELGYSPVLMTTLHALAWLGIGFGAAVAAAPVAPPHTFPSLDRRRLTRSALWYALIVCATPLLVLSPLGLPAIVLLARQLDYTRRGLGDAPGAPPARMAQWACAAVALPLAYAAVLQQLGAPAVTFPRITYGGGFRLAEISVLVGALLIQVSVWQAAKAGEPPVASGRQTAPELAFAGLIVAAILFSLSLVESSAGWRVTRGTEVVQLIAGTLMYLSGRAAGWRLPQVFGATTGSLALYVLLLMLVRSFTR